MNAEADYRQLALHKKWKDDSKSYEKPKRTDPNAPRVANLIHVPNCTHSLGYILFVDGTRTKISGSAAIEFVADDPESLRKSTLSTKSKAGFHIYYKHTDFWYGIPQHFTEFADAIPFLQGGNRVIVEYRFTHD